MKTFSLLATAAAVGLVSTVAATGAQAAFDLKLSTVVNAPHPWIEAAEWMAKDVAEKTNGEVKITIFPGGALGKDATAIDQMRLGSVDFVIGGTTNATRIVKEFQVFSLNYLFEDLDTFRKVTAPGSPVVAKFQEMIDKRNLGFKLLALGGGGTRNFSNNVGPVESLADIQGVKMRVPGAKVAAQIWSELGALPTSLPWTELYTAVQTGVVNAFESSISGYNGSKLYEVAKFHAQTQHQILTTHLSMSTATYNRLPEGHRNAVVEAAKTAGKMFTDAGERFDGELLKKLQDENGVVVTEVDKSEFVEKLLPLHDTLAKDGNFADVLVMIRKQMK